MTTSPTPDDSPASRDARVRHATQRAASTLWDTSFGMPARIVLWGAGAALISAVLGVGPLGMVAWSALGLIVGGVREVYHSGSATMGSVKELLDISKSDYQAYKAYGKERAPHPNPVSEQEYALLQSRLRRPASHADTLMADRDAASTDVEPTR